MGGLKPSVGGETREGDQLPDKRGDAKLTRTCTLGEDNASFYKKKGETHTIKCGGVGSRERGTTKTVSGMRGGQGALFMVGPRRKPGIIQYLR